ncbi:MAG: YmdB family metallophosphoesterase [Rickettsiales bacterium]|nr:YmdB family metallophosphoesterase [Rickettsiales bacterium]
MKILFLGDIIGDLGFESVKYFLPILKSKHDYDVLIVNGENITRGAGISKRDYIRLKKIGVDLITLGNHFFVYKDIKEILNSKYDIIRPANVSNYPGIGFTFHKVKERQLMVINLMMTKYMTDKVMNPFEWLENKLKEKSISIDNTAIFIDIHGTCSYEKTVFGTYFDGRVSFIAGTHTHTMTNDYKILPCGTGYISDAGMCGSYYSCSGADLKNSIKLFYPKASIVKNNYSEPKKSVSGVYFEINKFNLINKLSPIKLYE